jgi:hypothetical protein
MKSIYRSLKPSFSILFYSSLFVLLMVVLYYLLSINHINKRYIDLDLKGKKVSIRKFPYPYNAALSICSDIDFTETTDEFTTINHYLNTDSTTSLGKGLGLDIKNSFFMFGPQSGVISFFQNEKTQITILDEYRKGYVDVLHSFGNKKDFTRSDAITYLNALKTNGIKLDIWSDHTRSPCNFGNDKTRGYGDIPGNIAYHADLTIQYGIKFVWLGRVTEIIGQETPVNIATFSDIIDSAYLTSTVKNAVVEFLKNVVAVFGSKKYALHKTNNLLRVTKLDDGQKVYEFMRYDRSPKGVSYGANSKGLAYAIQSKYLNSLVQKGGYMIVYTHLGKNDGSRDYFPLKTRNALENMQKEFRSGNIWVVGTSELLNYYINAKYLDWSSKTDGTNVVINIQDINDPVDGKRIPTSKELKGITFYIPDNTTITMNCNRKEVENIKYNPPDKTGHRSVSIY